jgi:hypothetical protein
VTRFQYIFCMQLFLPAAIALPVPPVTFGRIGGMITDLSSPDTTSVSAGF